MFKVPLSSSVLQSPNWYQYGLYFSNEVKIKIVLKELHIFKHFWAKM